MKTYKEIVSEITKEPNVVWQIIPIDVAEQAAKIYASQFIDEAAKECKINAPTITVPVAIAEDILDLKSQLK